MTYQRREDESWIETKKRERGERAVVRQLEYQKKKSEAFPDDPRMTALRVKHRGASMRKKLDEYRTAKENEKVLEVGSGAHGLIFGFGGGISVGLDPLAVQYSHLFPGWQSDAHTIAAVGEQIPFGDDTFDVVLSDNVVDHAADPVGIIFELVRVLRPGGLLYFTVNTHHPVYQSVSVMHGMWNALGIKFEITPFADHTIHFTQSRVKSVFEELPVRVLSATDNDSRGDTSPGLQGKIKKFFPKNVLFEVIAVKNELQ